MKSYKFLRNVNPYKKGDVVEGLIVSPNTNEIRVNTTEGRLAIYKIGSDVSPIFKKATPAPAKKATPAPTVFKPMSDNSAIDEYTLVTGQNKKKKIGVVIGASIIGASVGVFLAWKMKKTIPIKIAFGAIGAIVLGGVGLGTSMLIFKNPPMPEAPVAVDKNPMPIVVKPEKPVSYQESMG